MSMKNNGTHDFIFVVSGDYELKKTIAKLVVDSSSF